MFIVMPVLLHDQLSTLNRLFGCVFLVWHHHLQKVNTKQVIGVHFQMLFSTIFLFFDVRQYSYRLDHIKDIRPAISFNNQKIIAYHL